MIMRRPTRKIPMMETRMSVIQVIKMLEMINIITIITEESLNTALDIVVSIVPSLSQCEAAHL